MRYFYLFLAGLALALVQPPVGLWFLVLIIMPLVLHQFSQFRTLREAILKSWIFGFGYFCFTLHWIAFAFFENAAEFLWMMPFAVGGLSAVMALYWAAAGAATFILQKSSWPIWLTYPVFLSVGELLRGRLMTGFPWAVPGLAADGMGGVAQVASLIGMTGLTLLFLLWGGASYALLKNQNAKREKFFAFAMLALLPLAWGWGNVRLHNNPTTYNDSVGVRLVQPNLQQSEQWRRDHVEDTFEGLLAATDAPAGDFPITHVIWPESIVPFLLDESENGLERLKPILAQGRVLLAGSMRRSSRAADAKFYTSIIVIDETTAVVEKYDKWRLVPGGEFLPFEWLLQPLGFRRVVALPESFSSGDGPRSMKVPGAGLAGMLICYEVVFPHNFVDPSVRPDWMVNVTNDGWFGKSVGPYQHLAQARMRAIEQGLPIMRAANTGVSAVIDPLGRILQRQELGVSGYVDSKLPVALAGPVYAMMGYAMMGDYAMSLLVSLLLLSARIFAFRLH